MLGADGQPAAGALVAVAWGTAPTPEIAIRTGSDGGFAVALPPGRFRIEANSPDGKGEAEIEVAGEPPEIEIHLREP